MADLLPVSFSPSPWEGRTVDLTVRGGSTIEEIVAAAIADRALWGHVEVFVDDLRVDREWWARVKPKAGRVISINVVPGDGGALQIGLTVGVIALSVAFPYAAPGLFGISAGLAGAIGAGIAIAGSVGLALAFSPETPNIAKGIGQDSPTYSFSGARNSIRKRGPVPHLFGEFRFAPPLAGVFIETAGGGQYIRLLMVLSSGLVTDPEIEIGDTDLDQFKNVQTEFKRGWHPSILTDQGNWDFTSGLFPSGADFGDRWVVNVGGIAGGRVFEVGDTIIRNHIDEGAGLAAWDVNHDKAHKLFPSDVYSEPQSANLVYNVTVSRTSQIDADELAVTIRFGALFQINSKGKKQTATVRFRIRYAPVGTQNWVTVGDFNISGRQTTPLFWSRRWTTPARGQYDVSITRLTVTNPTNDNEFFSDATWSQLDTFTAENPLGPNVGFSTLALRIQATGQLNGALDQVFCRCSSISYAPIPTDPVTWGWTISRLPAAAYMAVLQNVHRAPGAMAESEIDITAIEAWAQADDAASRTFDAYIDFATTEWKLLTDIAAAGIAAPATGPSLKRSVVVDGPKTTPVRLFSPRNTNNYRGVMEFRTTPHAFRVAFIDSARKWEPNEIIVFADGYDELTAHHYEDREYLGLTTAAANWMMARRELAELILRREEHTFETALQSVACQRGDLVRFQHHAIAVGLSAGRVRAVG